MNRYLVLVFFAFVGTAPKVAQGQGTTNTPIPFDGIPRDVYLGFDVSYSTEDKRVAQPMRQHGVRILLAEVQPGDTVSLVRFWDRAEIVTTVEIQGPSDIDRLAKEIINLPLVSRSENTYFTQAENDLATLISATTNPRHLPVVILLSDAISDYKQNDKPFSSLGEAHVYERAGFTVVSAGHLRVPLHQVGRQRSSGNQTTPNQWPSPLVNLVCSRVRLDGATVSTARPPLWGLIPGRIDVEMSFVSESGLARQVRVQEVIFTLAGEELSGSVDAEDVLVPAMDVARVPTRFHLAYLPTDPEAGELKLQLGGATATDVQVRSLPLNMPSPLYYWGLRGGLIGLGPLAAVVVFLSIRSRKRRRPHKYYDTNGNEHLLAHGGRIVLGEGGFGGEDMPTVGALVRSGDRHWLDLSVPDGIQVQREGSLVRGRVRYEPGQRITIRTEERTWSFAIRVSTAVPGPRGSITSAQRETRLLDAEGDIL